MKPFLWVLAFTLLIGVANAQDIVTDNYEITPGEIIRKVEVGTFHLVTIEVTNKQNSALRASLSTTESIDSVVSLSDEELVVPSGETISTTVTLLGPDLGQHNGSLRLSGGLVALIPVGFEVTSDELITSEVLDIRVRPLEDSITAGGLMKAIVDFQNLIIDRPLNVSISYWLRSIEQNETPILLESENRTVNISHSVLKEIDTNEFVAGRLCV